MFCFATDVVLAVIRREAKDLSEVLMVTMRGASEVQKRERSLRRYAPLDDGQWRAKGKQEG
jgi:hypothetical protein